MQVISPSDLDFCTSFVYIVVISYQYNNYMLFIMLFTIFSAQKIDYVKDKMKLCNLL